MFLQCTLQTCDHCMCTSDVFCKSILWNNLYHIRFIPIGRLFEGHLWVVLVR